MAQAAAREPANHGANPPDFAAPRMSACKRKAILKKGTEIIVYFKKISFPLHALICGAAKSGGFAPWFAGSLAAACDMDLGIQNSRMVI